MLKKRSQGRPRKDAEHRSADRQAYIDAAFAILREGGTAALTARSVALRVGVAVGSVYTSFDSLEALRLEANALTLGLLRTHLDDALTSRGAGTIEERLLCLADAYIGFADANHSIWAALFEPRTLPAPPAVADGITNLFAVLEGVLQEAGVAPYDDASVLARALWSSVHGMVYLANTGGLGPIGRNHAPSMVHALVRAVTRGLA